MEEDLRLRMESNKIVVNVLNGRVALGVAGPSDFVVRMTRLCVDWAGVVNGELTMKNGKWKIDNGKLWWVGLIGGF